MKLFRFLFLLIGIMHFTYAQECKSFLFRYNTDVLTDAVCPELLIEDLKLLYVNLQNTHPDLYRNTTKTILDSAFHLAIKQCSSQKSVYEFTLIINDFLSNIKDSHTFLNYRELLYYSFRKRHFLPFWITEIDEKFYISKSWKNTLPVGAELLLVNNQSIKEFKNESLRLTPQESIAHEAKEEMSSLLLGSLINLKNKEKENQFVYVYRGDTVNEKIVSPKIFRVLKQSEYLDDQEPVRLTMFSKKAILSVSTFSPPSIIQFKKQLDKAFEKIQQNQIEELIIDLRYNTGGYIMLQEYLMSFIMKPGDHYAVNYVYKRSDNDRFEQLPRTQLWKFKRTAKKFYPNGAISREYDFYNSPMGTIDTVLNDPILINQKEIKYLGASTLLINGMSMSASVNFAAWFQHTSRGKIIGSSAMGTNTGTFANPAAILLPNTMLPILISTMKINPVWNEGAIEEAIRPQIPYIPTHKSISESIDPLLQDILNK